MIWFNIFAQHRPPKYVSVKKTKKSLNYLTDLTERLDILESTSFTQFEYFKVMADSLDMPIWGKDLNGKFIFLNKACAKKILHSTVEQALNLIDDDFKKDALAGACMQSDKKVMKTKKTQRFLEYAVYGKTAFWMDCTKSPWIRDEKLIGTVGSGKDITKKVPQFLKNKYRKAQSIKLNNDIMLCETELYKIFKEKIN